MKHQLFTKERDVREERPVDADLFELLSSAKEWCALYSPVGEPTLKKVPKTPFGQKPEFEEILVYEERRLVAVNRPMHSEAIAEIYDRQNNCTYVVDNKNKKIIVTDGIREPFDFSGMGGNSLIFKGRVEDIIQEFKEHGYTEKTL